MIYARGLTKQSKLIGKHFFANSLKMITFKRSQEDKDYYQVFIDGLEKGIKEKRGKKYRVPFSKRKQK